jgi:DNA-binding transcriptional MerR regulator/methylmalonyl-CoA mutase cobalamin-binding subunit
VQEAGFIRIGELSRRTGVSPELLRAWERRYGLFTPDRSPGRFRLYSGADVARVQSMKEHIAHGLSAAEAARIVLERPAPREQPISASEVPFEDERRALLAALLAFDEPAANTALDRLVATLSLESLLREVIVPVLQEIGERWSSGDVIVAQEHFASNVLRGRLLALGRGWGRGLGPQAVLAAPPREQHDLGLVILGLALRDRGWRVTFLGADTPIETIEDSARRVDAGLVVVASARAACLEDVADALASLAASRRTAIAGEGAGPELAQKLGAQYLASGPIEAADQLTSIRTGATW